MRDIFGKALGWLIIACGASFLWWAIIGFIGWDLSFIDWHPVVRSLYITLILASLAAWWVFLSTREE